MGPAHRPASEPLGVIEVQVGEDHVLDLVRVDPQLPEGPDHRSPLHDQAGIHQVIALSPDQRRVREGDHAHGPPLLLQRLVALEAIGRAVDRRRFRHAVRKREDVTLGGHQEMNAGHRPYSYTRAPVRAPSKNR